MYKKYQTKDLLKCLGVPRDTLRFYEKKGLLNPHKDSENNYRNYDVFDIFNIMIIDFYKKRGMTINQINDVLKNSEVNDIENILEYRKLELQQTIHEMQRTLERIEQTQEFSLCVNKYINTFTLKPMPEYVVKGEVSDFVSIEEYESVNDILHTGSDDMLSQIIRYIAFNEQKVLDTKILIAKEIDGYEDEDKVKHLDYPRCLYTVVQERQSDSKQVDLLEHMHQLSAEYAKAHDFRLLGEAFAMVRLITYEESESKVYIEVFIPVE